MQLKIIGRASDTIIDKYADVLDYKITASSDIILFFDFSEYDILCGHEFFTIETLHNRILFAGSMKLMSISQEFGLPFDSIPRGYKTICRITFIDKEIPSIIRNLPKINDWYEENASLILK